jgi:hypothetical protein
MLSNVSDGDIAITNQQLAESLDAIPYNITVLRGTRYPVTPLKGACVHCNYTELCRISDWKSSLENGKH